MSGSEFLGRAKSFRSRRHHHPDRLEIIPQGSTQKSSLRRQRIYEQQIVESAVASAAAANSNYQISLYPTNNEQRCALNNYSPNQSNPQGSLDREMIGLALGSPRESPLPALPSTAMDDSGKGCQSPKSMTTVQSGSNTIREAPDNERHKGTKWKNLGGLFGRKALDIASPSMLIYKLEPSIEEGTPRRRPSEEQQSTTNPPAYQTTRTRLWMDSPKITESARRASPIARSPKTEGEGPRRKRSLRRILGEKRVELSTELASPRVRTVPEEEEGPESPEPPPKDYDKRHGPATLKLNGGSLLEVDIPDVQLERFSIMFGSLLQPQPPATLLTRRLGQLELLRSTDDSLKANPLIETSGLPLPSRPHSTSPVKSPILSLFPSTSPSRGCSPGRKQPLERSPLHRSATAIGLSSPCRTSFSRDAALVRNPEQEHIVLVVHSPLDDSKALELARRPNLSSDLSRCSGTSTEASFYSASETQPVQFMPKPIVQSQRFPERTTSVKGGQPLKITTYEAQPVGACTPVQPPGKGRDFRSKPLLDLQPLTLNPPTPRFEETQTDRSKYIPKWRGPSPVNREAGDVSHAATGVSHKDTKIIHNDPTDSRSQSASAIASLARKTSIRATKGIHHAEAVNISRRPSSPPPHPQKPRLNPLQLPPLPYSGSQSPEDIRTATEVSIARQISVSHRQRELLVPIVPKVARQPMLVDVHDGSQTARKSQHLVLEDA